MPWKKLSSSDAGDKSGVICLQHIVLSLIIHPDQRKKKTLSVLRALNEQSE